jgi:hypothetical protein
VMSVMSATSVHFKNTRAYCLNLKFQFCNALALRIELIPFSRPLQISFSQNFKLHSGLLVMNCFSDSQALRYRYQQFIRSLFQSLYLLKSPDSIHLEIGASTPFTPNFLNERDSIKALLSISLS